MLHPVIPVLVWKDILNIIHLERIIKPPNLEPVFYMATSRKPYPNKQCFGLKSCSGIGRFISPLHRLRKYKDDLSAYLLQISIVIRWDKKNLIGWTDWQGGEREQQCGEKNTAHCAPQDIKLGWLHLGAANGLIAWDVQCARESSCLEEAL